MINKYADKVAKIHEQLHEKADDEKEFLGWIKLPTNYDKAEFEISLLNDLKKYNQL